MRLPRWQLRPAPEDLSLHRDEVLRFLGYKPGTSVLSPRVEAEVDRGIALACRAARPAAALAYCAVAHIGAGQVTLTVPGLTWRSRALARVLSAASGVTLVAATLGPGIEAEIEARFREQDYAVATVVDAAGTALVQALGRHVVAAVQGQAGQHGLAVTDLFSPGYADWPIEDLPGLTLVAGGPAVGLTCSPTCYLTPQKSLVGLIGWVDGAARRSAGGCAACGLAGCPYRRVPVGMKEGDSGITGTSRQGSPCL